MAAEAVTELAPGYRTIALLRRGNDLEVYDAWSEERDCRCVIKVPGPDKLDSRRVRRNLLAEGRLLLELTHPHIVRAYEVRERPLPLVVLETLDGATLGWLIENSTRRLPLVDVVYLGLHLSSALGYLHRHGILHLDVKPSNVVAQDTQAKLLDLSIARPPSRCRPGLGTPQYMAPEQIHGRPLTEATDVFGLAATLYEAATGVRPFGDSRNGDRPDRPEPVGRRRRLPGPLAGLLDAALEPDPAARPALGEVAEVLRDAIR